MRGPAFLQIWPFGFLCNHAGGTVYRFPLCVWHKQSAATQQIFQGKETEMQNFQRLLESPLVWLQERIEQFMVRYRKSVERRRDEELRRRFLNG